MLLSTKLIPPHHSEVTIPRPRLFERLEQAVQGRLTIIVGPPGYGKTTLVADWLSQSVAYQGKTAWLSLDEYDDEPIRFMQYFVAALQSRQPNIGESIQDLLQGNAGAPRHQIVDEMMMPLIHELGLNEEPMLLILDDFHLVTELQIIDGIRFWIEHAPIHIHTILLTRDASMLPVSRWRARRQCTEITISELSFTADEATAFVQSNPGLSLTDLEISQVTHRTEGWAAGLQLAALSLQGVDDPSEWIDRITGTDRHIMDYLVEEVLEKQTPEIRDFLLKTSILKRLSPSLCDTVTSIEHSFTLLEAMEKRNLFLVPADNQRQWYRYHPLFAEALQNRLHILMRGDVKALHRKAYEWFTDSALYEEAIEHALLAEMNLEAAQCIENISQTILWQEGRAQTFVRWCDELPMEFIHARPALAISLGWAQLLSGNYDSLAILMQALRKSWSDNAYDFQANPELKNEVAVFEAEVAINLGHVDRVLEMLDQFDPAVDLPNPATQAMAYQLYGYAYRLHGNVAEAKAALRRAIEQSERLRQKYIWMFSHVDLAETHLMAGELVQADSACHNVIRRFPSQQYGYFQMMLARSSYLGNRLTDAITYVHRGLSADARSEWMYRYGRMIQAEIEYLQGNWTAVQEIIDSPAYLDTHKFGPRRRSLITTSRARLYLLHGDWKSVAPWTETYRDDANVIPRYQLHRMDVTLGRYQYVTAPSSAINTLVSLQVAAQNEGWAESLIEINILLALTFQAINDRNAASQVFEQALAIAEPEGILSPFLIEGATIVPLLRDAAAGSAHRSYVGQLQAAFLPASTTSSQPLVEPLTKRELDVLKMMADGLSNPEIADRLIIATGTVAKHTNNIFGKLDVRNRTEATQRAQSLGLL